MRRIFLLSLLLLTLAGVALAFVKHYLPRTFVKAENGKELLTPKERARYYDVVLRKQADSIQIIKHLREMYVYRNDTLLKIYRIALGGNPTGPKHFEGDLKTPEGIYHINGKNAFSTCHKNLGISYPNDADRAYARKKGKSTGGDIKIHGLPNGQGYIGKRHRLKDWTWGCIAITDDEVDELFAHATVGIPVSIVP